MNKKIERICAVIFIVAAFAILAVSCSQENNRSSSKELTTITLTEELSISADLEAALIGNFSGLAVGNDGTIYAADTRRQTIHAFSPQGAYIDSIGRQGKGPGEFERLDPDIHVVADTLYAMQSNARRVDLFNINTGEPIRTVAIPDAEIEGSPIGSVQRIFPQDDGSFLIYFMNPHYFKPEEGANQKFTTVAALDASGNFINKNILQFPTLFPSNQQLVYQTGGGIYVYRTSIFPVRQVQADATGTIYLGTSDSLLLRSYNRQGSQIETFEGAYTPNPFTEADLDSLDKDDYQYFRDAVNQVGVPERWPAFQKFLIDDEGRSWVQLMNPGSPQQTWWLFNAEGNPQWKFTLPAEVELFDVKQGKAYGIFTSEQSLPEIRRYNATFN